MAKKSESVFNVPTDDKNQGHLLEQYKLYVESANLTSSLRSQANTYYLTINTILVSFLVAILGSVDFLINILCESNVSVPKYRDDNTKIK